MFGIGWSELLLVGVVCLFIFGPEDIPKVMYTIGRVVRRLRYMQYALSSQFDDFMDKTERKVADSPASAPVESVAKARPLSESDDEIDADVHYMAMIPPPENLPPDVEVALPDDDDARPDPDTVSRA